MAALRAGLRAAVKPVEAGYVCMLDAVFHSVSCPCRTRSEADRVGARGRGRVDRVGGGADVREVEVWHGGGGLGRVDDCLGTGARHGVDHRNVAVLCIHGVVGGEEVWEKNGMD